MFFTEHTVGVKEKVWLESTNLAREWKSIAISNAKILGGNTKGAYTNTIHNEPSGASFLENVFYIHGDT